MKVLVFILLLTFTASAHAQDPAEPGQVVVKWSYSAKKVADKTYEVMITGKPQAPWHIYSSTTPEGGPLPTTISFNKNPLVTLSGKLQEKGKVKEKFEEVFEVNVRYFEGNAAFVQVVKLKSSAKTNLSGTIEFMACTDEECLPPQTINFTVRLD